MHHSQKATGCFIVARGQPTKLFEAAEKAFDFVAVPVEIVVNDSLDEAVLSAGNHRLASNGGRVGGYGVGIAGFVGQHVASAFSGRQQFETCR